MKRRFLFLLMAVFTFAVANAAIRRENNKLYVQGAVSGEQGATVEFTLNMKNSLSIKNWQTTLVLPEGVTLVSATAAERWTETIQVDGNQLFSETEAPVAAGDGVAAKIVLQIASTVAAGQYDLKLFPMAMTAEDGTSVEQTEAQTFTLEVKEGTVGKKGDLNGDGFVDASDIQIVLNDMADETNDPSHDLNGDGFVDASDIQVILNIMAEEE